VDGGSSVFLDGAAKVDFAGTAHVVSDVLLGAYRKISSGFVLLMSSLTDQDYSALKASEHDLQILWPASVGLVQKVMIPFARHNVVHADIRPGYDYTTNLLYSPTAREMRMIDYESLTEMEAWPEIMYEFLRNIKAQSAFAFVWWQCITLAYAWLTEIEYKYLADMEQLQTDIQDGDVDATFKNLFGENWSNIAEMATKNEITEQELESRIEQMTQAFRRLQGQSCR